MHRVPDAYPTEDAAAPRHAMPSEVIAVASITNPFGAELESAARVAALDGQLMRLDPVPEAAIHSTALGCGAGQTGGQIIFRFFFCRHVLLTHCQAARRIRSLTGATIGPETTSEIFAPGFWQVEAPRHCRTASVTSSSPCM